MEQIRIVKEMRDESIKQLRMRGADDLRGNIRCRFLVWENVCGAFSSNSGSDFQAVLEEIAKVAERDACIPGPPNGKWPYAGCVMGSGWSIAWRIHDGQFWGTSVLTTDGRVVKRGTPQRRKRISLVADFGGSSAPQILFERKGLSGNIEESGEQRQGAACDSERGVDPSSYTLKIRGGVERDSYGKKAGKGPLVQTELSGTLGVSQDQTLITKVFGISSYDSNSMKSSNPHSGIYETDTTRTLDLNGGNPACNQGGMIVLEGNGSRESHKGDGYKESETMFPMVMGTYQKVTGALDCGIAKGTGNQLANQDMFVANSTVVRRLTPLECERLQGFPDFWTDIGDWVDSKGKKHNGESDSPRYKALGNSICLPFWQWMAEKMVKVLKDDGVEHPTMASLFDGIGGFPLVYSRCGCEPVWASEIEEFPIAVTKIRFPDKEG